MADDGEQAGFDREQRRWERAWTVLYEITGDMVGKRQRLLEAADMAITRQVEIIDVELGKLYEAMSVLRYLMDSATEHRCALWEGRFWQEKNNG